MSFKEGDWVRMDSKGWYTLRFKKNSNELDTKSHILHEE